MHYLRSKIGSSVMQVPSKAKEFIVQQVIKRTYTTTPPGSQKTCKASTSLGDNLADDSQTVFRVQGGTPPKASKELIVLDENNNVRINQTTLNISMGDPDHAKYFLDKRPGAHIVLFKISRFLANLIEKSAIPQANYKSNPANQNQTAPKIVDPATPGKSYELPPPWAKKLEKDAIPGSGKIIKGTANDAKE